MTLARPAFLGDLLRREAVGGSIALIAAAIAVVWVNSPVGSSYDAFRHFQLGPLDLEHWGADGALTLFFFVAGLELKREFVVGSLRKPVDAAVPVVAAICGVAVPALIYLSLNSGLSGLDGVRAGGWAIPAATDIAFALAVLAVVGLEPADPAAGVPAHAGGRRRPDRDRDHRGLLHLEPGPASAGPCRPRVRGLGVPAAPEDQDGVVVRAAGDRRLVDGARERHPRHRCRGGARAADPGASRRDREAQPGGAPRARPLPDLLGRGGAVLRAALRGRRPGRRGRPALRPRGDRRRPRARRRQADRGVRWRVAGRPGSPGPS